MNAEALRYSNDPLVRTLDEIAQKHEIVFIDTSAMRIDHWESNAKKIIEKVAEHQNYFSSHISKKTQENFVRGIVTVIRARENITTIPDIISEGERTLKNKRVIRRLSDQYRQLVQTLYGTLKQRIIPINKEEEDSFEEVYKDVEDVSFTRTRTVLNQLYRYDSAREHQPGNADLNLIVTAAFKMRKQNVALLTKDWGILICANELFKKYEAEGKLSAHYPFSGFYTPLYEHYFYPARNVPRKNYWLTHLPGENLETAPRRGASRYGTAW